LCLLLWGQFVCFVVSFRVFLVYFMPFVLSIVVVGTSASDCLERLLFKMIMLCVKRDIILYSLTHSVVVLSDVLMQG